MSINTVVYQGIFELDNFRCYLLLTLLLTSSVSAHFGAAVNTSVVWGEVSQELSDVLLHSGLTHTTVHVPATSRLWLCTM